MVNGEEQEIEFTTEAVRDGRLVIPIRPETPLREATKAQTAVEKAGGGKVSLVAQIR